jgi:hypothetical protein
MFTDEDRIEMIGVAEAIRALCKQPEKNLKAIATMADDLAALVLAQQEVPEDAEPSPTLQRFRP